MRIPDRLVAGYEHDVLGEIMYRVADGVGGCIAPRAGAVTIDCEQRSLAWRYARAGIITASRAKALSSLGAKALETLAYELAAEMIAGPDLEDGYISPAMQRGIDLEPEAVAYYEMTTGKTVTPVGLVIASGDPDDPCRMHGASPDGWIESEQIGLEVKCPNVKAMLRAHHTETVPSEYVPQVQWSMHVTGAEAWDLLMYTDADGVPSKLFRVERYDPLIVDMVTRADKAADIAREIVQSVTGASL